MATEPKPNASPVCYLDEADNIYRGYAEIAEIRRLIQRWIKLSPSPAIEQALTALLPAGPGEAGTGQSEASGTGSADRLPAAMLSDEMRHLLPRIGDDLLHARLKAIADMLALETDRP